MFSSSSRQADRLNADGSRNVFCYQCNEFIAVTHLQMGRALCELCRRIEAGEEVTEAAVTQYLLAKAPKIDVSMLLLPEEPRGKKFSLRSLGGVVMEAIGLAKPEKQAVPSAKLAKEKKRTRLFQNVDLGSIEEFEVAARKGKQGPI